MNTAEKKLNLFRRIDNLSDADLKRKYDKILVILDTSAEYRLNSDEKKAIEDAIEESEKGKVYTQEQVMAEAKQKYSNLKFK